MSSGGGKGFNVTAAPFNPRARVSSMTANSEKNASIATASAENLSSKKDGEVAPAQPTKPETYSDRAKKAVNKEREVAAAAAASKKLAEEKVIIKEPVSPSPKPKSGSRPSSGSNDKVASAAAGGVKATTRCTKDQATSSKTAKVDEKQPVTSQQTAVAAAVGEKKKSKSEKHVKIPVRYSRDQLKTLKASTWKWQLEEVQDEERVDHPPFSNIPKSYAKFFECRAHLDWINWESVLMRVPASRRGMEKSFGRSPAPAEQNSTPNSSTDVTAVAAGEKSKNLRQPPVIPMDDAPALPPATAQSDYQQEHYRTGPRSGTGGGSGNNRHWGTSPGLQAMSSLTNSPYHSHMGTPDSVGRSQQYSFHCTTCASPDSSCCEMIANLIHSVKRKEKTQNHGFLTQAGDVVIGSVQILLAFEHRATSRRMKLLHERFPKVKNLVKAYLCGEGFHIPPPSISNEDVWSNFLGRLKFDYIRDNRTKVFTELSKHWKRSHTKFEQFAHFASFRDAVPYFPTIGMITNTQKPLLVSCSTGDIEATIILGELGYNVMADVFWDMLPYYEELPNHTYAVLRHLCVYYFKRQQRRSLLRANKYAQVAPSPALPPMRPPSAVASPMLVGNNVAMMIGTTAAGAAPSPVLSPAGVSAAAK